MGCDQLVVVVRGVASVDAVGAVDQLEVVELPVVALLDVQDTALLVGQGLVQTVGRAWQTLSIKDNLLLLVGAESDRRSPRATLGDLDVCCGLLMLVDDA